MKNPKQKFKREKEREQLILPWGLLFVTELESPAIKMVLYNSLTERKKKNKEEESGGVKKQNQFRLN